MTESSAALTAITSGSTFEEYMQSIEDNNVEEFLKDYNVNSALVRDELPKVLYVPGFIERFHCAEFALQKKVLYILKNGKCVWSTYNHLKLIQDSGLDHVEVSSWRAPMASWHAPYCDGRNGRPTAHFGNEAIGLLITILSQHEGVNLGLFPQIDTRTLTLLAIKHGEDKVLGIIDLWTKSNITNTFYDFVQLVEDWDSTRIYPLEWTLNVITTHRCEARVCE